MPTNDKLKPCPFCGKKAWLRKFLLDAERDAARYSVGCSDPECIGYNAVCDTFYSEEDALAAWNRRPC